MTNTLRDRNESGEPDTYFASPGRAGPEELRASIARVTGSPLLIAALEVLGGWVAVLNQHRQVLAVNHAVLLALGIDDPASVLGLRPGEALGCTHATEHVNGCGTGKTCMTCGAAIAMVAAQKTYEPQGRKCVLTTGQNGSTLDRVFEVHCASFQMEGEDFLLICMQDISAEQRRVALERAFLHDFSNILMVLTATVDPLNKEHALSGPELRDQVREAVSTLSQELHVQRLLCRNGAEAFRVGVDDVRSSDILNRVEALFTGRNAEESQDMVVERPPTEHSFKTDVGLLIRVLVNMVVNAFEAGGRGDQVRIGAEETAEDVTFYVWNRHAIPDEVVPRIFQRYFSTKNGNGRGVGTFSMKLLGEMLLKGDVSFTTSEEAGTTFRVTLPRDPSAAERQPAE